MLPNVIINIENGALGGLQDLNDGIAGFIGTGVAADGLALNTPKQIFSVKEAEDLGLNAQYDIDNSVNYHRQLEDFYKQAGTGAELWFSIVPSTYTMELAFTVGEEVANLLDAAKGTIRVFGCGITHDSSSVTGGLEADVLAGATAAQALALTYASKMQPTVVLLSGNNWSGVAGDLTDLRTKSENKVGIVLAGIDSGVKEAAIGLALGRMAVNPVQRNLGRVKDGDLGITAAFMTDGTTLEANVNALNSIHDKGYIIPRTFAGKAGYFFNDDFTATALTDDYSSLARNRVINKAMLLAYATFVEEVNDEIEIQTDGTLPQGYITALQSNIETSINNTMTASGEISSVSCVIDAAQDVLSTEKLIIGLRIIPVAYSKEIQVNLGFSNPALTA